MVAGGIAVGKGVTEAEFLLQAENKAAEKNKIAIAFMKYKVDAVRQQKIAVV